MNWCCDKDLKTIPRGGLPYQLDVREPNDDDFESQFWLCRKHYLELKKRKRFQLRGKRYVVIEA